MTNWDPEVTATFAAMMQAAFEPQRARARVSYADAMVKIHNVTCPYCFVTHGECRTKSGAPTHNYHSSRWDVAYGHRPPAFLIREEPW